MIKLKMVPDKTAIPFVDWHLRTFVLSTLLALASVVLYFNPGLNTGIDFEGGILIEVGTERPADIGAMRSALSGLGLGEVALQEFGSPTEVLIRIERQPGGEAAQDQAINTVKQQLSQAIGQVSYRRVEFVGPKVSGELVLAALQAVAIAVVAMLLYIWFRFEWQFSVGAVVALIPDVVLTIGMFALTRIEFNLASVAAILTIVGYSINDTVVVYDRVRENLRKYKNLDLPALLNVSVNDTLARTTMTSVTTLLALLALFFFGGEVIRGFAFAMIWGVVVGTYSSIFIAAPLLLHLRLHRGSGVNEKGAADAKT